MSLQSLENLKINDKYIVISIKKIIEYIDSLNIDIDSKVLKVFNLASLLQYSYNAYDYRENLDRDLEVHNLFKLINIYGYGLCKQSTLLMGYLLDMLLVENRVLYLGRRTEEEFDHFAIEVFYNNKWHYFDPNLNFYFINKMNEIASVNDIKKQDFVKVIGDFSAARWLNMDFDNFKNLSNIENFRNQYLKIFHRVEEFILNDNRFEYKNKLMKNKGLSKWYLYNQKEYFFDENVNVRIIKNGYGIIMGKKTKSTDYIEFKNLIFKFKNSSKYIIINDFSFLILGVKIYSKNDTIDLNILINGINYNVNINSDECIFDKLIKKTNILSKPIYSFVITSNHTIFEYEIITQVSYLVDYIYNMFDNI